MQTYLIDMLFVIRKKYRKRGMRQGPAAVGVAVVVSGGTSTGAIALASLSGVDLVSQVIAGG